MERRIIAEFPDYEISEDGRVFHKITGKEKKRYINRDGYNTLNFIDKDGVDRHRRCARLVGFAFHGDKYEEGLVIDHIDHDRQNDHYTNLEWVTTLENNLRSIRINPHKHTRDSEYDEDFIRNVCSMIQEGVRNVDIRSATGISKDALLHIRCGAACTWISKDYIMTPSRRGISEETAAWVCHKLNEGLSPKDILKLSTCDKLSIDIVKKIKNGKSWTNVSSKILK